MWFVKIYEDFFLWQKENNLLLRKIKFPYFLWYESLVKITFSANNSNNNEKEKKNCFAPYNTFQLYLQQQYVNIHIS